MSSQFILEDADNATQIPDSKPMVCTISDPTSNARATSDTKDKFICSSRSVASIIDSFKGIAIQN